MSNRKQQVVDLLKAFETGAADPVAVIDPDKYIQHNPSAEDGLAGLRKLLQVLPAGAVRVNTVRVFEDGDYVFAHTDYDFFGPKIGSTSSASRTAGSSSTGTTSRRPPAPTRAAAP